MSSGSVKDLHPQPVLDEDDESLDFDANPSEDDENFIDPIIAKLNSFVPSLAKQKQIDPVVIEIQKGLRQKRLDARAKLWGLATVSETSNNESSGESVAEVTVLDGVVSVKFENPLVADEWAKEIRNFLERRLP